MAEDRSQDADRLGGSRDICGFDQQDSDTIERHLREDAVTRKVFRRLIWFLFLAMMAMSLDRSNIAFAALSMNKALGLSATAFGFASSVFAYGFFLAEVPSNMALDRFGARIWICRIMITWGLASTAMMLATGAASLYALRFLLGLAEGGFIPGIILYVSFWFPEHYRARATGLFLLAQPVALSLGAPVSGLILQMDGLLGIAGWRWLFLLEGFPTVVLGVAAFFWLTDKPTKADWLTADEASTLDRALNRQELRPPPATSRWRELRGRTLGLLCLSYIGVPVSIGTFAIWSPLILRDILSAEHGLAYLGWIAAIPAVCASLFLLYWSRRSDRHRERTWHLVGAMLLAALGWATLATTHAPSLRIVGICCGAMGSIASQAIFYPFATARISQATRPIGIAVISSISNLFGSLSPLIIGALKDLTHSYATGILFSATMMLFAAVLVLVTANVRRPPEPIGLVDPLGAPEPLRTGER